MTLRDHWIEERPVQEEFSVYPRALAGYWEWRSGAMLTYINIRLFAL